MSEAKTGFPAKKTTITVFLSGQRDDKLLGEGIMRDLARRVQALRKEMGFVPTETLESVHIAELDAESMTLLGAVFSGDGWTCAGQEKSICTQPAAKLKQNGTNQNWTAKKST